MNFTLQKVTLQRKYVHSRLISLISKKKEQQNGVCLSVALQIEMLPTLEEKKINTNGDKKEIIRPKNSEFCQLSRLL